MTQTSASPKNSSDTPQASPPPNHDCQGPWYFPTWTETAQLLGWRWLPITAGLIVLLIMLASLLGLARFGVINVLIVLGFKGIFSAGAVLAAMVIGVMRRGVQMRKDPFCIHCGYSLTGLPDHQNCPECGRPYHLELIDEYRRDPHWYIKRAQAVTRLPSTHAPFAAGPVAPCKSTDGTG